jgi:hypothetical protein
MYTWVFESPDLMVFKNGTRSRFILDSVLGEWYVGILVSDAYGARIGFVKDAPGATGMLCWAHFRRDLKLCMDHGGKAARDFGGSLNIIMDDTFAAFNDYKVLEDKNSPEALELYAKLRELQKIMTETASTGPKDTSCAKVNGIIRRFTDYPENYFNFIEHPEIGMTNNPAERAVRYIVNYRKNLPLGSELRGLHAHRDAQYNQADTVEEGAKRPRISKGGHKSFHGRRTPVFYCEYRRDH